MRTTWTRAAVIVAVLASLAGCWWPEPGQGPNRAGHNPFETAITVDTVGSLEVAWTAPIGTPLVASGRTVLTETVQTLSAARIADGVVRWTKPTTLFPRYPWSDPILAGDRVLRAVAFGNWDAHEFDEITGEEVGTVVDGRVESVRGDRRLYEGYIQESVGVRLWFRVDDPAVPGGSWGGTSAWTQDFNIWTDMTFGTTRVYSVGTGLMSGIPGDETQGTAVRAYAADAPATCGPVDTPDWPCPVWVTPLDDIPSELQVREVVIGADEATLYLTTAAGNLYALDAATGAVEWSAAAGTGVSSRPAVADGVVYLGNADGRVLAFAADGCGQPTCTPLWDAPVGGSVGGQPTVAGGVVFVGTAAGTVVALDGAGCGGPTCAPIWSATVGTGVVSQPIVSAGRLLVGNAGTTVAFTPTA